MNQSKTSNKNTGKYIINYLIAICVVLGFICIFGIYLPDKVPSADAVQPPKHELSATRETHETAEREPQASSGIKQKPKINPIFATPPELEHDVLFWKNIYTKYDTHQVVFHDPKYLFVTYSVLDFTKLDADTSVSAIVREKEKEAKIEEEKKNIAFILDTLSQNPLDKRLSEKELRIKKIFDKISEPNKFKKAKDRGIRAQSGQKDKFIEGLKYSKKYLKQIEKIFEKEGLPKELTRLIFVESMFNPNAHSSVGARGIWQFMKSTGKICSLKINSSVDERLDPILSTYAAAKLLRDNYEELGSWPLAINAYNTGRGRLKQAVARLGTTNIATIVRQFDHSSYGFASRNFYMEFLAALEVVENRHEYFGDDKGE